MTQVLGFTARLKDMSDILWFDKQKWQIFGLYFRLFRANPGLPLGQPDLAQNPLKLGPTQPNPNETRVGPISSDPIARLAYYKLPVCRKQPAQHTLQLAGKERLCVFCRYLRSPMPLLSTELGNSLLSHPQALRHNKTRQFSYQCSDCQLFLWKEFCFSHYHDL